MAVSETVGATPLDVLLDRAIADPDLRAAVGREVARLGDDRAPDRFAPLRAETQSADRWTSRARPTFLYVMYALLLWSLPMGLIAAVRPATAQAIAHGMAAYLNGLPEPLYTLFGTGYLGYTVARTWAKAKGVER